jgi:hypothetical protein
VVSNFKSASSILNNASDVKKRDQLLTHEGIMLDDTSKAVHKDKPVGGGLVSNFSPDENLQFNHEQI